MEWLLCIDYYINSCTKSLQIAFMHVHLHVRKRCSSVQMFCHPGKLYIQLKSSTLSPVCPVSYAGRPAEEADRRWQKITETLTCRANLPFLQLCSPATCSPESPHNKVLLMLSWFLQGGERRTPPEPTAPCTSALFPPPPPHCIVCFLQLALFTFLITGLAT